MFPKEKVPNLPPIEKYFDSLLVGIDSNDFVLCGGLDDSTLSAIRNKQDKLVILCFIFSTK